LKFFPNRYVWTELEINWLSPGARVSSGSA